MIQSANPKPIIVSFYYICLFMLFISCAQETNPKPAEQNQSQKTPVSVAKQTSSQTDSTYSNIRPKDYVGPQACAECHKENHQNWQNHPHSRMNALANAETILGNFSNASIDYAGRRAVFKQQEDKYIVEYYRDEELLRQFKITRVIGWRYEQDYVGFQIQGPEPLGDPIYQKEIRLGFSYALDRQKWFPQSYLEPTEYPGSEYLPTGNLRHDPFEPTTVAFNQRCARCHNTYSYDTRLYKIYTPDGMLSGFPPGSGIDQQTIQTLAKQAGDQALLTSDTLPTDRFVTEGISCESCHFGGREHANHGKEIRFVPTHPLLANWTPDHKNARKNPAVVNGICRQCHHSGADAPDNWPDGSAGVNSMESTEQDRGGCANEIKCTDCHNTHISGPKAGSPDRPEHLNTCVTCHEQYQSLQMANAHSRHTPDQANCLDCHMPRIVQGFGAYNRTHRIASPTDPKILATGMPNACNLCHLDKPLSWTQNELEKIWGKQVPVSRSLTKLFGQQLDRPVGEAWLDHPIPLVRLVTAGAYAHSQWGKKKLPDLISALSETNAYTRYGYLQNIEKILGHQISDQEYTLLGSPSQRAQQVQTLLKKYVTP